MVEEGYPCMGTALAVVAIPRTPCACHVISCRGVHHLVLQAVASVPRACTHAWRAGRLVGGG